MGRCTNLHRGGLAAGWLLLSIGGLGWLACYRGTPGRAAAMAVPAPIALDSQRMTLVLSLHPKCPCSTASVRELEQIITRSGRAFDVRVLAVESGEGSGGADSPLLKLAGSLPGVRMERDPGGELSRRLGASTSGHVVVLAADGRVLFRGGITSGRGHEGDNAGRTSILSLLKRRPDVALVTPVFGCALRAPGESYE